MMILSSGGALLGKPATTTAHEKTQITGNLNVPSQWFEFPLMTDQVSEVMGLEVSLNHSRYSNEYGNITMEVVDGVGNVLWSKVWASVGMSTPDMIVGLGSTIVTGNTLNEDYRIERSLVGAQGLKVRLRDTLGKTVVEIWFEGVGYGA